MHFEWCAHYDEQIALVKIYKKRIRRQSNQKIITITITIIIKRTTTNTAEEAFRKGFAKEDNVWLDQTFAAGAPWDLITEHHVFDSTGIIRMWGKLKSYVLFAAGEKPSSPLT